MSDQPGRDDSDLDDPNPAVIPPPSPDGSMTRADATPPEAAEPTEPAAPPAAIAAAAPPAFPSAPARTASGAAWAPLLTRGVLLGGFAHVGIVLGASLIGAAVLLVVLAMFSASDAQVSAFGPTGDLGTLINGVGAVIGLLFTLAAAILGGELTVSLGGGAGLFSAAASGSVWIFPLTLTVAVVVVTFWWGVRQELSNPVISRLQRAAYALAVGLVTGIVLLIIALIFAIRADGSGAELQISAAGYRVVLFSTLLVGSAAYLGREAGALVQPGDNWITAARRLLHVCPRAVREWLTYATFGSVLFGVIGFIYVTVEMWDDAGPASIGLALVGMLNIAALLGAVAHLGGVVAGAGVEGAGSGSSMLNVFSGDTPVLWLAVLATVLLAAFVALWVGTRRPRTDPVDLRSICQMPVLVAVSWLVIGPVFFGAGFSAEGAAGIFGGAVDAGIGVAPWTVLVMVVWAAVIELGAQTLPHLAYGTLPHAHAVIVGRRAVAAWVAGTPASPVRANGGDSATDAHPFAAQAAPGAQTSAVAPAYSAEPAPSTAPAPPAPPKPLSPAARRTLIITLSTIGGVVVLAIAGSIAIGVINGTRSPEALAEQYLDHIAEGRATAANALVDPNVPNADRRFLTDEVMASATQTISDVSVKQVEAVGDTAGVQVSYKLDGVTQEAYLEAEKGDPEWLVLDTWNLTSSLATENTFWSNGPGKVSIGGVPVESEGEQATAMLYPGVYELSTDGSEFYELQDSVLTVAAGLGATKELQFVATDALREAVAAQVDAVLEKCITSTDAAPDGCPFSAFTFNDDTKVTWTLKEKPVVEISDNGTDVQVEGVAVASYTEEFFGTTRERDDEDQYGMYGKVSIDGGEVEVAFDDTWW